MIEIYFIIMFFIDFYQHEIFSEFKMLDLTRFITYRGDDIIDDDVLVVDRDDWDDLDYNWFWIKNSSHIVNLRTWYYWHS